MQRVRPKPVPAIERTRSGVHAVNARRAAPRAIRDRAATDGIRQEVRDRQYRHAAPELPDALRFGCDRIGDCRTVEDRIAANVCGVRFERRVGGRRMHRHGACGVAGARSAQQGPAGADEVVEQDHGPADDIAGEIMPTDDALAAPLLDTAEFDGCSQTLLQGSTKRLCAPGTTEIGGDDGEGLRETPTGKIFGDEARGRQVIGANAEGVVEGCGTMHVDDHGVINAHRFDQLRRMAGSHRVARPGTAILAGESEARNDGANALRTRIAQGAGQEEQFTELVAGAAGSIGMDALNDVGRARATAAPSLRVAAGANRAIALDGAA